MKLRINIYLTFAIVLMNAGYLTAQVKSVLWLGNSYTATNNLPDLVYQLALSGGDTLVYDSNTPGGYRLDDHWSSLTSQTKITQRDWDYVVLQAQSQEPSWDSAYVTNWLYPYGEAFDSVIHLNDSCTQLVFYMTWGRKNGDASYCAQFPWVCTYQGMQNQLTHRYLHMAHTNNAIAAPCGEAWRDVIATTPAFDLYLPDESHPSLHGSYLNACVFYATIYRRSPVGLPYYAGLPQAEAAFLQQMAASTVLDSMSLWNTEVYYDDATFSAQPLTSAAFMFSSLVQGTNHQWNFGNGFVPGNAVESYTFQPGTYTVTHVTDNGCLTDTFTQVITAGPVGLWECIPQKLTMYPNPASESLTIENPFSPHEQGTVKLMDAAGNVVLASPCSGERFCISTAELPGGYYTVVVTQGTQSVRKAIAVVH